MRIAIVGSGGREHALAWRLHASGHEVLALPGNPGMASVSTCIDVPPGDFDAVGALAAEREVDLVVIGPEGPLVDGLADRLRMRGLVVFGPSAAAARLEGSKVFAKEFFRRHGIRTAEFVECRSMQDVERALAELGGRVVVKADGLAAGKGVVVCDGAEQALRAARMMLEESRFGEAGSVLLVERRLSGREVSVLALCDGARVEILPPVEDHKAVLDGDRGPNTGGMGTISPVDWVDEALRARVEREIFAPTLAGLAADGLDYRGVLYAGLMIDDAGTPWILEYNCRFGDPETQPLMVRLDRGDLGEWLLGAARGAMPTGTLAPSDGAAVCVVLASEGYPGDVRTGEPIDGLELVPGDVQVFHAGTASVGGRLVTAGGRVLGVTAVGKSAADARRRAYDAAARIRFPGVHYRRDIGDRRSNDQA